MKKNKLNYTIASYREDYAGKSKKDLNAALLKNKNYGNFMAVLGSGTERQLVFTRTKAYLYADHINLYEKLPRKFIYIEAVETGYVLISILNGKVFFEGLVDDSADLFKQINVFVDLNADTLQINIYAPETQDQLTQELATNPKIMPKILDAPISSALTPNKHYLTHNLLLKERLKLYQMLGIALVAIAVIGGIAYEKYNDHLQKQALAEQQLRQSQQVDRYLSYKNQFKQNSGSVIVKNLLSDYEALASAIQSGWVVNTIDYDGSNFVFGISSDKFDNILAPLNQLASKNKNMDLQYGKNFNRGGVNITFPIKGTDESIPNKIVPIKPQVVKFTDNLSLTYKNQVSYSQSGFSFNGSYQSTELTVVLSKITLAAFAQFLANVDLYPAKITSLVIQTSAADLSVTCKINFYGE